VAADDERHDRTLNPIDVWDCATFDPGLVDQLESEAERMLRYFETDQQIFLEHDLGRGAGRSILRPENPHAERFSRITEAVAEAMDERTIRAWHYTRLTDAEVEVLRRDGVHLSTPSNSPLPPAAVLDVHTEGEPAFEGMGRGYPASFVDIDIGRWKELTGEDD
jgi:hypothetical protein